MWGESLIEAVKELEQKAGVLSPSRVRAIFGPGLGSRFGKVQSSKEVLGYRVSR